MTEPLDDKLENTLRTLIREEGVDTFYVGNQGNFDNIVLRVLRKLKKEYEHISYVVILSYLPKPPKLDEISSFLPNETIYPEGLETKPPRFAISYRNRWMIDRADCVVGYVIYTTGGAAKFLELAKKKGKIIINLALQ